MERYLSYINTGNQFLGEIPTDWDKVKFNHFVFLRHGYQFRDFDFTQTGIKIIKISQLLSSGELETENVSFIEEERLESFEDILINEGDILMALTGGTIGKIIRVREVNEPLLQNYRVGNFFPINDKLDKGFLFWILSSQIILDQIFFDQRETGQPNIGKEDFGRMFIALPKNTSTQTQIANYLDTKTAEIDNIIAAKKKLITLYEEEKAAVINQAVTKGINPDVTLKPSGVEWLGDIPEHWQSVSLKWISKIYSGGTPFKNNPDYWHNGNIPWLNSGTVNQGFITEPSEYITEEALANSSAKWIPELSLVMALAGQGKTKGMVAQVLFETTCNQSLGVIVPNEKIDNKFLMYWLRKNYQNIRNLGGGDKRDGINLEMIGSIPVPIATIKEQTAIVEHIESNFNVLDTKIKKANQLIELLTEYRTTLISEVVTGKIKVTA